MHDPMTAVFTLGPVEIWHRDRRGVDGACDRHRHRGPYLCLDDCDGRKPFIGYCVEQKRFLRELQRNRRRRLRHVHHWRILWIGFRRFRKHPRYGRIGKLWGWA